MTSTQIQLAEQTSFLRQLELLIKNWNETIRENKIIIYQIESYQKNLNRIETKIDIQTKILSQLQIIEEKIE